ncbi:MAG: hypothetical protein A2381_06265 [Bdellovibrionales bacterium RIFOXYB1_FULL_37_110]|nr:MAG: hypothetical protein A2417_02540 [Bdellovibrionales bacterium RIFOXYC1_FULL_37_79]OFZ60109.1 MAG: hypothetical protein A2381_06265 [Bdellovibrionales bacterium RIFOXYB1_FULL_37_110]OFZ63428.1 MAG: hypothetical protein A2577_00020 [Bdellovibrionales bacterium RIFOXYD1_FULL_36_51]
MFAIRVVTLEEFLMTLCEQLKDIVAMYFERFPKMSINGLAQKSKVGATTIRRILNNDLKGAPAPHTVLSIVSTIYKERELSKLLSKVEGPIGEMLRECYSLFVKEKLDHKYDVDLNDILSDRVNYLIYKLAANKKGTTKIKIVELFGLLGEKRLNSLLNLGLILEKDEAIHAKDKNFSLDIKIAKKLLPELIDFYKPEEVAKGKNLFYSLSESLNEDGIKKIKEIQKEAVKKIYEAMNCPFYEGDIPYFTLNMSDTLTYENNHGALQ